MKGRVYIVDDDAQVRRSTCFLLHSLDYDCRSFPDGETFLHEARSLPPGCVLLDLYMPGPHGLDVQNALSRLGRQLPVIAMTGHTDSELARRTLDAGALNMLEKPFAAEALLSALSHGFACIESEDHGSG